MKIAITGKMCSGKSTLANKIVEKDQRYQIFSFGGKVKEVATDLFNMKQKDRTLLVSIGTKMREIDPDVWTNYVIKQTEGLTHCIIDDLRYQNEYEALSNAGFEIIQLVIDEKSQKKRIIESYPNNYQDHLNNCEHSSEKNTFNWLPHDEPIIINTDTNNTEKIMNIINNHYQGQLF
tara:strand:+ start:5686 stop:6216 length:531 start_codon:yes stop_codon:yes gene_type:complete